METLHFALDYPTTYDFILWEMEMLLIRIPKQHRKYVQSIYLKPNVVLKLLQIVDHVLMDMDSLQFAPSVIASAALKCCFHFQDWQQGLERLTNPNWKCKHEIEPNRNTKHIPRLVPPTPSPISPAFEAKLSGQISAAQQRQQCIRLVVKYVTVPLQYWYPSNASFDYEKTLRNNILTYQTWRQLS